MTTVTFDRKKAEDHLSMAKIKVMMDEKLVFFSVLMMNMTYRWRLDIPTAATDGRSIYINPNSYADLTPGQRVSRLMHEVLHVALAHLKRKGTRNHEKWNRACDYYINLMLTDAGFERISTWLWNDAYRGMSAEEIYAVLPEDAEPNFEADFIITPDDEKSDQPILPDAAQIAAMDQLVIQAAMQAQKGGGIGQAGIPSSIAFYLDKLLNPKLPWEVILKRYFGKYIKKGYTWKTPNRRYSHEYLPSRGKPSLDTVAFAADISGSVSDSDYQRIITEVSGALDRMKPSQMHFIQFSDNITSINKIRTVRELKAIKFEGRGGTDVTEVFQWAEKHKPKVLVILTDGGFYWPRENGSFWDEDMPYVKPACDVVWLIHDNPDWTAIHGKTIHYTINH